MSDSTAMCGVCCLRHLLKPSTVWCCDCEEGLCLDCKEHHSLLKATRNHNLLPITDYQKLPQNVLEISQQCKKHNEVFQTFCKKHDCPCCRKCIIETHNICNDLIEIENYIKDVKSSSRLYELEEMLNETAENIKRIRTNRQTNLTSLHIERKNIEKEIEQTSIKINNHLDKLQSNVIQDLNSMEAIESEKVRTVLQSLDEKQKKITEIKNSFENIKKYASDVQLFLSMKQIETDLRINEEYVQSFVDNKSLYQATLVYKDKICINNTNEGILHIGKVAVELSASQISIQIKKEKQAQTMAIEVVPIVFDNIELKLLQNLTECGNELTGCTLLPNGKMAFANEKQMDIRVAKSDGSLDFKIDLQPYHPFDITYICDNNTIAVTSRKSCDVKIIDLIGRKVQKNLNVGSLCSGVTYTQGRLLLCSTSKGIIKLNQHNGSMKTIVSGNLSTNTFVASLNNKIFYTNLEKQSVICCDFHGNIQWTFIHENLSNPFGVTVDKNSNVFVGGHKSDNIIVISPDGQRYKQVLSSADGIESPNDLIFDNQNSQLLISNIGTVRFCSKYCKV